MKEQWLSWRGAVRVGDTMRRPSGPGTNFVRELLSHLRRAGIRAVPEPLDADEQGREVYRWIDGEAGAVPVRAELTSEAALTRLAELIREVHDASAGFRPAGTWNELLADPGGSEEVICHNDLSVPNTIYRQGRPVAIVDWEFAAPGSRLWDLAYAAWWCVPLHRPECAAALGWPAGLDVVRRLRAFANAYGLSAAAYADFFDTLHQRQLANQRQLSSWVEQGLIPAYDDTDPTIEVGLTNYMDDRRDALLAALRS